MGEWVCEDYSAVRQPTEVSDRLLTSSLTAERMTWPAVELASDYSADGQRGGELEVGTLGDTAVDP